MIKLGKTLLVINLLGDKPGAYLASFPLFSCLQMLRWIAVDLICRLKS